MGDTVPLPNAWPGHELKQRVPPNKPRVNCDDCPGRVLDRKEPMLIKTSKLKWVYDPSRAVWGARTLSGTNYEIWKVTGETHVVWRHTWAGYWSDYREADSYEAATSDAQNHWDAAIISLLDPDRLELVNVAYQQASDAVLRLSVMTQQITDAREAILAVDAL